MRLTHVHPLAEEGEPALADAAPDRVLAGSGTAKVWNAFTGENGRFSAGIWQAQPGVLSVSYTETGSACSSRAACACPPTKAASSTRKATPS